MGFELLKGMLVLLIVLGGIYVFLRLLKQKMLPRKGMIEVVHYQALGPKKGIALIKVLNEYLVVGITEGSISLLSKPDPAAVEDSLREESVFKGLETDEASGAAERIRRLLRGKMPSLLTGLVFVSGLLMHPSLSFAAPAAPPAGGSGLFGLSTPMELLVFLTLLSILPSLLVMVTSFTRIVVVLSFLRQALGTPQVPPTQVIIGLSLFVTLFIMAPVTDRIYNEAYIPYTKKEINGETALERAGVPLKEFMLRQTKEKELAFFLKLSKAERPARPMDLPLRVVVPAFAIGELKKAFEIGFLIFLPFLVIDMVVSSVLLSLGMMMLPPVMVSMPFKLLLFVLVDGWELIIGSLVGGFK
ncbi:MAG: flagellar type III secretion system pore protein FliP [Alphaproteobacteria bacterium]|uniref:Flagellar biosynthetic protein FliP n=1 Tax=Candidatus Nitrobium versatile TaxID=2884831 RepID=A0A953M1A9_9BACT|nr:flagellar type III secretion system pore protein FliP [Candidatus Nitrobium versatile]